MKRKTGYHLFEQDRGDKGDTRGERRRQPVWLSEDTVGEMDQVRERRPEGRAAATSWGGRNRNVQHLRGFVMLLEATILPLTVSQGGPQRDLSDCSLFLAPPDRMRFRQQSLL